VRQAFPQAGAVGRAGAALPKTGVDIEQYLGRIHLDNWLNFDVGRSMLNVQ
jgi:hypothetical protein